MNYQQLTDLFRTEHLDEAPAEVHGILCGRLAGGEHPDSAGVRRALLTSLACDEEILDNLAESLHGLYRASFDSFADGAMAFEPLLPEDDVALDQRVAALADWCRGFLTGLADTGRLAGPSLSQDVSATLEDFVAISQVDADSELAEADEADFVELSEYVRVAAMLVFTELAGANPATRLH